MLRRAGDSVPDLIRAVPLACVGYPLFSKAEGTDGYCVYHLTSRIERVKPGANVSAMFYVDSEPRCAQCRVVSTSPFTLESTGDQAKLMVPGCRLMLVFEGGQGFSRGVTDVLSLREQAGAWRIETDKPKWEDLDKRTYQRCDIVVPVKVRAATDFGERTELLNMEGKTADLSLGGAMLEVPRELGPGALVEITMQTWPEGSRILGIVVRSSDGLGCAVKFVDFVGTARVYLHNLLAESA